MNPDAPASRAGRSDLTWVSVLTLLAFVARLGTRLVGGEAAFLENGYSFYLDIVRTFIDGEGLCLRPEVGCALRVPVYSLFLSAFAAGGLLCPGPSWRRRQRAPRSSGSRGSLATTFLIDGWA